MVAATAAALLAGSLSVTTAQDAPDLLPGVDLVTEEVKPGVYRVLGDGTHDLRQNVWAVEATDDGDVWVLKYRVAYKEMATPGRIKPRFRDARVLRLGESGVSLRAGQDNMTNYPGLGLRDGRPAAYFSNQGQRVWDGDRWLPPSAPWEGGIYCEGIVVPEVGCWTHNYGDPGIVRQSFDGSRRTISSAEIGLDADARFNGPWAPHADDGFYTLAYTGTREDMAPSHLVAFDGDDWSTAELPATGMAYPYMMDVLSDGSVWIGGRADGNGQMGSHVVARWDGNEWRTFEFAELQSDRPGLHEAADGKVWIDAVTYIDGSTVRQLGFVSDLGAGDRLGSYAFGPDDSAWTVVVEPGTPEELGCEAQPQRCLGVGTLYVITPEAVAAAE